MFNRQGNSLELSTYLNYNKKNKILTGTGHILHLWGDNKGQKTNFEGAIKQRLLKLSSIWESVLLEDSSS